MRAERIFAKVVTCSRSYCRPCLRCEKYAGANDEPRGDWCTSQFYKACSGENKGAFFQEIMQADGHVIQSSEGKNTTEMEKPNIRWF